MEKSDQTEPRPQSPTKFVTGKTQMTRKQTLEQNKIATLKLLREFKVHFTEPNPNHFKARDLNYWPSSGKIYIDGAPASLPDRGLQALEAELRARGYRRSDPTTRTNTLQPPHSTTPSLSVELDQA
jgi:hypothetical protein